MPENENETLTQNEVLLKEIRENYDYALRAWSKAREEFKTDLEHITKGPWSEKDRADRKLAGRPCISADELSQYINQYINDIRQNPRSIKLIPEGDGANDDTAALKQGIIRRAEEKSNAKYARTCAAEYAAMGGYGFYGLSTRYVNDFSLDQEIVYRPYPNPNCVLIDPDFKQPDASDMAFAFVLDTLRKEQFKRKFPKATVKDFGEAEMKSAPQWIKPESIQVAEYWKVKIKTETLTEGGKSREVEKREVWQYTTNGVEILEEREWGGLVTHKDGKARRHGIYIPIIPVFAKMLYVDDGTGAERIFVSMVRMAREPYMLYCYYRTNQAEFAGMIPKAHAVGYEGQFEGHEQEWANSHKSPLGYLQVRAVPDGAGGVLPLPSRTQYDASPIAVMDGAAESARRAIQAAMGISPLPTAAQRRNEKSGIALERIEAAQQKGTFHLVDNYDIAINHEGRIFNDLMPVIYDTARELGIKNDDDTYETAKINQEVPGEGGKSVQLMLNEGDHDVTISTGPSYESQREEANDFVDTLIANIAKLPIPPDAMGKMLSLAIRMKQLGALGDKMAEILSPDEKEEMPPQAIQALQAMQQQLQALDAFGKEMQGQVQQLTMEKNAKLLELDSKERIAAMDNQTKLVLQQMTTMGQAMLTKMEAEFTALNARLTAQQAEPENEFADAT